MLTASSSAAGAGKIRRPGAALKSDSKASAKITKLEEYIKKRDYTGASALLEFNRKAGDENEIESLLWIGYCAFHLANYQKAVEAYQEVISLGKSKRGATTEKNSGKEPDAGDEDEGIPHEVHLYMGCCMYYLQMYEQAEKETTKYTELEEAALRRQVKEKTSPAAIQKRRKEMQSENMSKVGGEKHNISGMSEEDVKQRIEKEVTR